MKKSQHTEGFTLLELSIVLVIIGLIIGGITVGQDMIRSAELNRVVSDFNKHEVAFNTFRLKYNALAGDMDNATSYWGDNTTHCADAGIADGTPGVCNGDGDGIIEPGLGGNQEGEIFMFWTHLAEAEIIPGSYTGIATTGDEDYATIGVNAPAGPITGSGWSLEWYATQDMTSTNLFEGKYGTVIYFGAEDTNSPTYSPIMTPAEAFMIDSKSDDGRPGMGKIKINESIEGNDNCHDQTATAASALANTAAYALSTTSVECSLLFIVND